MGLKVFNGNLTTKLKNISIIIFLAGIFISLVLSYDSKVEKSTLACVSTRVDSLNAEINEVNIRNEYRDIAIEEVKKELKDINSKMDALLIYIPEQLIKKRERTGE